MPWYTDSKAEPMEVAIRYQVTMKHRYEDNSDCKCYRNTKTFFDVIKQALSLQVVLCQVCTLSSCTFIQSASCHFVLKLSMSREITECIIIFKHVLYINTSKEPGVARVFGTDKQIN